MKAAVPVLFLFSTIALGATDTPAIDPGDDFSPMCFAFVLMALCIVLVLIGIGIVVAAVVTVSVTILMALGIVSASACIGVLQRRVSSGFRALHYQLCAAVALPAGVGVLWLGSQLFRTHLRHRDILAIGSVAGICGGLLLAFVFDRLAVVFLRLVSRARPASARA